MGKDGKRGGAPRPPSGDADATGAPGGPRWVVGPYRVLADRAAVAVCETDARGRCLYVNPKWAAISGLAAEEALGRGWWEGLHPDDRDRVARDWADCVGQGRVWRSEYRFRSGDGRVRWVAGTADALRDDRGGVLGYLAIHFDITDSRRLRGILDACDARFRAVWDHAGDAVLLTRPDGTILAANPAACALLARSEDQIRALGREGLVDRDDPRVAQLMELRRQTGSARGVMAVRLPDGTTLDVEASSAVFDGGDGQEMNVLILRGVDEAARARQALEAAERRFRQIVESPAVGVWLAGPDRRTTYVNDRMARMLGVPRERILGQLAEHFLFPEDLPAHRYRVAAVESGTAANYERRIRREDGSTLWIAVSGVPLPDADGGYQGTVAFCIDVTEAKKAQEELREASRRLNCYDEQSPLAIVEWDSGFRVKRWAGAAAAVFGWSAEEAAGRSFEELGLLYEGDRAAVLGLLADMADGRRSVNIQHNRNVRKDGRVIHCEWYNACLYDADGRLEGVLSRALDVTERVEAETRVQQFSQRLLASREEERRELATRLHHDLGSLAVATSARMDALDDALSRGDLVAARDALAETRSALGAGVARIKGVAVGLRPPTLDLLGLSAALRQLAQRYAGDGTVRARFLDRTGGCVVGRDQGTALFRIAQEAMTNAIRHGRATAIQVMLSPSRTGLRLSVRDDGAGFDPAGVMAAPGARLGLLSSREAAEGLGGTLAIDSAPGRGTKVVVELPWSGGEGR